VIHDDIDSTIAKITGNGISDRLRRNSLRVLRERWAPTTPPLRLQLTGRHEVTAHELALITDATQDAVAKIATLLARPSSEQTRVTNAARNRALLIPRAHSANTLLFDFPGTFAGEGLEMGPMDHLARQATSELLEYLPEAAEDTAALAALPERRLAVRSAVQTLATGVQGSSGISIELAGRGSQTAKSVLTLEQAREIPSLLSGERIASTAISVTGLLDGMRTRRRLFYIVENESGHEFEGSVGDSLLSAVQGSLGKVVTAGLTKRVTLRADGHRTNASYDLNSIVIQPEL
jgi:hypothetical protein